MKVHLVDGTYELFRAHFGAPSATSPDGREVGATRGLMRSLLGLLTGPDVTHVACAFDHVIESFRNGLYDGYKTSEGVPATLLAQFPILEDALESMGVVVWPMVYYEADDALASAATKAALDEHVTQVIICTPDKDLGQCVVGTRVVQLDRRREIVRDEAGVLAKFGVMPQSIPDYLAVLGDSADGYPGLSGWGEKAAAMTLSRYSKLENIPKDWRDWHPSIGNARKLSTSLSNSWDDALLFRTLATLRLDAPVFNTVDDLRWKGPNANFEELCRTMGSPELSSRAMAAIGGSAIAQTATGV